MNGKYIISAHTGEKEYENDNDLCNPQTKRLRQMNADDKYIRDEQHTYKFTSNLRFVLPYKHEFCTYVKRRWVGRSLKDVLCKEFVAFTAEYFKNAIDEGNIKINHQNVTSNHCLKDGEQITHQVTIHEPPILNLPIEIISIVHLEQSVQSNNKTDVPILMVVNKPCSFPAHPGAAYRYNTLLEVIKSLSHVHLTACVHHKLSKEDIHQENERVLQQLKKGARQLPLKYPYNVHQTPNTNFQDGITPPVIEQNFNDMMHTCTNCKKNLLLQHGVLSISQLRPIHRLDRLTSGLTLLTNTAEIARQYEQMFRENHSITKTYLARVIGNFNECCKTDGDSNCFKRICQSQGYVFSEDRKNSKYRFDVNSLNEQDGKYAETEFEFICYDAEADESLILCRPKTGRTHQLRTQLLYLNHPISNDPCYGPTVLRHTDWFPLIPHSDLGHGMSVDKTHASGIFLHAWKLKLPTYFEWETRLPNWC